MGGIAALLLIVYSLGMMVQMVVLAGHPERRSDHESQPRMSPLGVSPAFLES
jgi:hypothetical protein